MIIITVSSHKLTIVLSSIFRLCWCNNTNQLITLSAIALSGFHCILDNLCRKFRELLWQTRKKEHVLFGYKEIDRKFNILHKWLCFKAAKETKCDHGICFYYYFERNLKSHCSWLVIDRILNLNRKRKYQNFGLSVPKPKAWTKPKPKLIPKPISKPKISDHYSLCKLV